MPNSLHRSFRDQPSRSWGKRVRRGETGVKGGHSPGSCSREESWRGKVGGKYPGGHSTSRVLSGAEARSCCLPFPPHGAPSSHTRSLPAAQGTHSRRACPGPFLAHSLPSPPQLIPQLQVGQQPPEDGRGPRLASHGSPSGPTPARGSGRTPALPAGTARSRSASTQPVPPPYVHPARPSPVREEPSATLTPWPSINPCHRRAARLPAPPYLRPLRVQRAAACSMGPRRCQQLGQPARVGVGIGAPRGSFGPARPAGALQAYRGVTRWRPRRVGCSGQIRRGGLDEEAGLGWGLKLSWLLGGLHHAERGAGHGGTLLCLPFLLLLR